MIIIIDSGMANTGSVVSACRRIGIDPIVSADPAAIVEASALILPGVGSFAKGMESLRCLGLVIPIREAATAGIPILGICLGMQLLAEFGEEFGTHKGLGLISGEVVRLQSNYPGDRVPNIGWCDVEMSGDSRLFAGIENDAAYYFMHSYHLICTDHDDIVGRLVFGKAPICVAVERGAVWGVQFHPEKSQEVGLHLLSNYLTFAGQCSTS